MLKAVNLIQDRGGGCKKFNPATFFPVTSTDVRLSQHKFLTFSFNLLATLLQNLKVITSASPQLLNSNQDYPSKKWFFWSNPYKIKVLITSLIEMLEFPNFGHLIISGILFESHDKIFLLRS